MDQGSHTVVLPVREDEEESTSENNEDTEGLPSFTFKVRLFHSRTALQVGYLEHLEALVGKEHQYL